VTDAIPLTDDQIDARLAARAGWTRDGDTITRTFAHTYHECVHLAMYVAAKAREIGHHPDIDIRWQRIRFSCTTHDADHRITGSPDHRITGSPDHRITGSPDHRITGSPDHRQGFHPRRAHRRDSSRPRGHTRPGRRPAAASDSRITRSIARTS